MAIQTDIEQCAMAIQTDIEQCAMAIHVADQHWPMPQPLLTNLPSDGHTYSTCHMTHYYYYFFIISNVSCTHTLDSTHM